MSEAIEKQLAACLSQAWNATAGKTLGGDSELSLLALREVSGDGMAGALAVAMTWSAAFVATGTGALGGIIVCLFKSDDATELDRLAKQPTDGSPKPGARALVNNVLVDTAEKLAAQTSTPISFDLSTHIDLTTDEARLAKIVGDAVWVGTYSLTVGGGDLLTQALMLYAPHGSLAAAAPAAVAPAPATPAPKPATPDANANMATQPANNSNAARRYGKPEPPPRNIERLLEVELEIVVRFGVTNMPLRDVVRMGIGAMIELNRAVDEPVELLVNDRPLARGEVVVVDGYYGVRITEINTPAERALSIVNSN